MLFYPYHYSSLVRFVTLLDVVTRGVVVYHMNAIQQVCVDVDCPDCWYCSGTRRDHVRWGDGIGDGSRGNGDIVGGVAVVGRVSADGEAGIIIIIIISDILIWPFGEQQRNPVGRYGLLDKLSAQLR